MERCDLILLCTKTDFKKQMLHFIDEDKRSYQLYIPQKPQNLED